MTETGRMDRVVLLLLGSSQTTWAQVNPQAIQGQVLTQVMVLLTSSPDHIILAIAQEEAFGLAWVQEEFWDICSEVKGVSQTRVIPGVTPTLATALGDPTRLLPGPHHQAQEPGQPQDLVVPKGAEMKELDDGDLVTLSPCEMALQLCILNVKSVLLFWVLVYSYGY